MAAVNGHHVPGSEYHWFHTWKPRDVATALVYGKVAPHQAKQRELRKVTNPTLQHRMEQSVNKGKFDVFDKLAGESDRRDAARAAQRSKVEAARAAKTAHYDQLITAGHSDEHAVEKAFGIPVQRQRDQAALAQLRGAGHHGAGLKEAARKAYSAEIKQRYHSAEAATNGHMLSPAGRAAGVDPGSLFTGNEARARKYASPELKEWFDQHGRPSFDEYLSEVRGHAQDAARARAGRGDFLASASDRSTALNLSAKTAGYAATPHLLGPNNLWFKPGFKLPNYIENVVKGLMESGKGRAEAIPIAIGTIRRWASGGGNVHPEVRAASADAIAQWEALKVRAKSVKSTRHFSSTDQTGRVDMAGAFDPSKHPRVASGPGGGQFTTAQQSAGGAPRNAAAAQAQANPQAKAQFDQMKGMTPAQQAAFLATLTPAQRQALTAFGYSAKTSDPTIVQARTSLANANARHGAAAPAAGAGAGKGKGHGGAGGGKGHGGAGGGKGAHKGAGAGGGKGAHKGAGGGKGKGAGHKAAHKGAGGGKGKAAAHHKAPAAHKPAAPHVSKPSKPNKPAIQRGTPGTTTVTSRSQTPTGSTKTTIRTTATGTTKTVTTTTKTPTKPSTAGAPTVQVSQHRSRARHMSADTTGALHLSSAYPGPETRRRMAAQGIALPDGSFPIPDRAHVHKAIQAIGRAPEAKRPKVVAHIRKHARRLGMMSDPKVQRFMANQNNTEGRGPS